jgi:HD-like signal output (HDOD) protein
MSESEAKIWLRDHGGLIPALDTYHQQARGVLESETASRADLANIIALDPGMSISLFNQTNRKMDASNRPKHETIHSALGLLGENAISEFVTAHKSLNASNSSVEMRQSYHQLASRGFHLMAQLVKFVEIQGMQPLNEIRSAAILHNVGELAVCLFEYDLYSEYKNSFNSGISDSNAAKSTFGFIFSDLGKLLARQWRLPDLVAESLDKSTNIGRNARLIQLAGNISEQAETGWIHDEMKSAIEVSASFLNQPAASVETNIKTSAIESAREFAIDDVFPAAARLILLPDVEKHSDGEKTPQMSPANSTQFSFQERIKSLVKSPAASQSSIIKLLADNLYSDLSFSRVAMILISKDRSSLTTRLGNGLSEDSPFHRLNIKTTSSGLFKSLMLKPQALWINSANYKKFDSALPDTFKATCMCDSFFLMSLFVGNNSIGFVYCDRSSAIDSLDQTGYEIFKSYALMTSKALTFVAQRGSKSTA